MTTFTEIYEFFLNGVANDYRIKNLLFQDPSKAEAMFEYWLYKAIVIYQDNTPEKLENVIDSTNKTFTVNLNLSQKVLLGQTMVLLWLQWNINDITQMNNTLTDNDFKHYAEERNLNAKVSYHDKFREILYHEYDLYCLKNFSPSDWGWVGNLNE